jgi:hypothetical protein
MGMSDEKGTPQYMTPFDIPKIGKRVFFAYFQQFWRIKKKKHGINWK